MSTLQIDQKLTCSVCKQVKSEEEFSRDRGNKSGRCSRCKSCDSKYAKTYYQKTSEVQKSNSSGRYHRLKEENPEILLEYSLKKYNLTPKEYYSILKSQGGVCALCENPDTAGQIGKITRLPVDHCHKTGVVRGILCVRCNTALGKLNHDPVLLRKCAEYLERFA